MFERCGVSKKDVIALAGMSQAQAAHKCGISYHHFWKEVKHHNLSHLFTDQRPSNFNHNESMVFIKENISVQDVKDCSGLMLKDAANELGVTPITLGRKLKKHFPELRELFPSNSTVQKMWRQGYAYD